MAELPTPHRSCLDAPRGLCTHCQHSPCACHSRPGSSQQTSKAYISTINELNVYLQEVAQSSLNSYKKMWENICDQESRSLPMISGTNTVRMGFCRLCSEYKSLTLLRSFASNSPFSDELLKRIHYVDKTICRGDPLPQFVCYLCIGNLCIIYDFICKVQDAQLILASKFNVSTKQNNLVKTIYLNDALDKSSSSAASKKKRNVSLVINHNKQRNTVMDQTEKTMKLYETRIVEDCEFVEMPVPFDESILKVKQGHSGELNMNEPLEMPQQVEEVAVKEEISQGILTDDSVENYNKSSISENEYTEASMSCHEPTIEAESTFIVNPETKMPQSIGEFVIDQEPGPKKFEVDPLSKGLISVEINEIHQNSELASPDFFEMPIPFNEFVIKLEQDQSHDQNINKKMDMPQLIDEFVVKLSEEHINISKENINKNIRKKAISSRDEYAEAINNSLVHTMKTETTIIARPDVVIEMPQLIDKFIEDQINELGNNDTNDNISTPSNLSSPDKINKTPHWSDYLYCRSCNNKSKSIKDLIHHSMEKHYKCSSFKCVICKIGISRYTRFISHMKNNHYKKLELCCQFCDECFVSAHDFKVHNTYKHKIKPNKCRQCGLEFEAISELKLHEQTFIGRQKKTFICDHCKKHFKMKCRLEQHMAIHYPAQYECKKCENKFRFKTRFLYHMRLCHELNLSKSCIKLKKEMSPLNKSNYLNKFKVNHVQNIQLKDENAVLLPHKIKLEQDNSNVSEKNSSNYPIDKHEPIKEIEFNLEVSQEDIGIFRNNGHYIQRSAVMPLPIKQRTIDQGKEEVLQDKKYILSNISIFNDNNKPRAESEYAEIINDCPGPTMETESINVASLEMVVEIPQIIDRFVFDQELRPEGNVEVSQKGFEIFTNNGHYIQNDTDMPEEIEHKTTYQCNAEVLQDKKNILSNIPIVNDNNAIPRTESEYTEVINDCPGPTMKTESINIANLEVVVEIPQNIDKFVFDQELGPDKFGGIKDCNKDKLSTIEKHSKNFQSLDITNYQSIPSWSDYLYCKFCNKKIKNIKALIQHSMIIHYKCTSFKCLICGIFFSRKTYFINHMMRKHDKKLEQCCEYCDESFDSAYSVKAHKLFKHKSELRPSKCRQCGLAFETMSELKLHEQTFIQKKNTICICHHCNKVFKIKSKLEQHMAIHYPAQYECKLCKKRCRIKIRLLHHIRINHDVENISKWCVRISQKQIESNEKTEEVMAPKRIPYASPKNNDQYEEFSRVACEICKKELPNKTDLLKHMVTHTKALPYECVKCPEQFSNLYLLKQHNDMNHVCEMFTCDICNKSFKLRISYAMHIKKHKGG